MYPDRSRPMGAATRGIYGLLWAVAFVAVLRPLWRWFDPVRGIFELIAVGVLLAICFVLHSFVPALGVPCSCSCSSRDQSRTSPMPGSHYLVDRILRQPAAVVGIPGPPRG